MRKFETEILHEAFCYMTDADDSFPHKFVQEVANALMLDWVRKNVRFEEMSLWQECFVECRIENRKAGWQFVVGNSHCRLLGLAVPDNFECAYYISHKIEPFLKLIEVQS